MLTLRYHHALAVIEASWSVSGPVPDGGPVIWGSKGTLAVQGNSGRREGDVRRGGALRLTSDDDPDGRIIDPPALPEGERTAIDYFLTRLRDDRPIDGLVSMEIGRDTQEILEAGLRSAREERVISLPLS